MVNLVDTPGHVDFSGKVTRAMRIIDGAIVVIDAVEGVMAQTENVLRSAIKERVRPVLFINKLDRLIRELKLSPIQIQERLNQIIEDTNFLISDTLSTDDSDTWEVSAEANTVAFGSALHKWGFNLRQIQEAQLKFSDIIEYYRKDAIEELTVLLPIQNAILDMILEKLPSPISAQKYRIGHIWRGDPNSPAGQALIKGDRKGPLIFGVTKIVTDSRYGDTAVGRLFSGRIKRGTMVRILPENQEARVQRVSLFMGPRQVVVEEIKAGNICGLVGLENTRAGNTVTGIHPPSGMVPFEEIRYVNEPVVTISIEPKKPRELPRLLTFLEILTKRDPNLNFQLNETTGENLLSGIGLLHLEVALHDIEKEGIAVEASDPIVLYREIPKQAITARETYRSPNGENEVRIAIDIVEAPIEDKGIVGEIWYNDDRNNSLVSTASNSVPESAKEALIDGFIWALERGPLAGEPIGSTSVQILHLALSDQLSNRSRVELMSMIKEALFQAFNQTKMTLLEPIYEIEAFIPGEFLRELTSVIMARRGKVDHVDHKGTLVTLKGALPVSESFDLANAIRSQTSGKAVWQTRFSHWEKLPEERVSAVVSSLRERKGWSVTTN